MSEFLLPGLGVSLFPFARVCRCCQDLVWIYAIQFFYRVFSLQGLGFHGYPGCLLEAFQSLAIFRLFLKYYQCITNENVVQSEML